MSISVGHSKVFFLWWRCKTGKHTTEKPVLAKATPTPTPKNPFSPPTAAPATNSSSKESCPRCKQGFFCSDHGSVIWMLLITTTIDITVLKPNWKKKGKKNYLSRLYGSDVWTVSLHGNMLVFALLNWKAIKLC